MLRVFVLASLLAGVGVVPVWAQTATLHGAATVLATGERMVGATVEIQPLGADGAAEGDAAYGAGDLDGAYRVVGLAPGRYRVRAFGRHHDGRFYESRIDTVVLREGAVYRHDVGLRTGELCL